MTAGRARNLGRRSLVSCTLTVQKSPKTCQAVASHFSRPAGEKPQHRLRVDRREEPLQLAGVVAPAQVELAGPDRLVQRDDHGPGGGAAVAAAAVGDQVAAPLLPAGE